MRKCLQCSGEFQPKRAQGSPQRYCSVKCREKAKYQRIGKLPTRKAAILRAVKARYARCYGKDYRFTVQARRWNWTAFIRKAYGLSVEEYAWMLHRQDFKCAICHQSKPLDVDHCHDTGRVRGMLCRACNTKTATLSRSEMLRAMEYLAAP